MTEAEEECPKCGNAMEVGFLLDMTYGNRIPTTWVEGLPERSWFGMAKIKDKILRRVDAYRCVDCGFLENYAVDEWTGWPKP